ncbi:unnamed protein product [Vitrella brassicaformis CCMP3155]|uniref:Uncharacterized protein n=1 Tax=Vitrella brassicaformis (strain CCMP3155) TaxID=1169540 RepID=A0A0G4FAI8_VITBC|nr:unnamed protein product [Vitrella brassicaformis CCMP3155]|eukprot:CEM09937.1 unnamed protein product [Vitrella brassicaformis CCMP3155]
MRLAWHTDSAAVSSSVTGVPGRAGAWEAAAMGSRRCLTAGVCLHTSNRGAGGRCHGHPRGHWREIETQVEPSGAMVSVWRSPQASPFAASRTPTECLGKPSPQMVTEICRSSLWTSRTPSLSGMLVDGSADGPHRRRDARGCGVGPEPPSCLHAGVRSAGGTGGWVHVHPPTY